MSKSENIQIVVLISEEAQKRGKYVLSLDVVKKGKVDSMIKSRRKDGFVTSASFLETWKSPVSIVEFPSKEGKCQIMFEVSGALKPIKEFGPGENVLEFTGKNECQKIVTLTRNSLDSGSEAHITLKHGSKCLHTVTIDDVPLPSGHERSRSNEETLQKLRLNDDGEARENVVTDFGDGSVGPGNQASPLAPRPRGVTVVPPSESGDGSTECSSEDDNDTGPRRELPHPPPPGPAPPPYAGPDPPREPPAMHTSVSTSSFRDESPVGKILADESLNALATALSPPEANRLIAGLGIQDAIVKQARINNPQDVVQQQYEVLRHWRHKNTGQGIEAMYNMLIAELTAIGRNDIKIQIFAVLDEGEGRKLTLKDLGL